MERNIQRFPTKKGARCSVENVLKRVIHDNPVGSILPSIDITNAISLKYAIPIGAEDAARTEITDDTTYEFIAMECVDGRINDLKDALNELESLMTKHLDATVIIKGIVNKDNMKIGI